MYSEQMYGYGAASSEIRELFTYGQKRKAEIGEENVFDFSLGNPSVKPPAEVTEAFIRLLKESDPLSLHGYTAAAGDMRTRKLISGDLEKRFGTVFPPEHIYMTCGAAAALKILFTALHEPGDELVCLIPYFPEYKVFSETAGFVFNAVGSRLEDLQPDLAKLEAAINKATKAVLINSPNNPAGVVYTEESLKGLADLLERKQKEYGHPIFLISDEPYRELVYEGQAPFPAAFYANTLVAYSYSKSFSMPGDRIGYIALPAGCAEPEAIFNAVCGAGRCLGYVCAPSLMQKVVAECVEARPDMTIYAKNRRLLYEGLTGMGYSCIYPDGAFYLCARALEADARAFSRKAKEFELLLVPTDSFGLSGFVRIATCVKTEQIEAAMPAFKKLIESYR